MKKSVLFLINGYAYEQKGSYSLYNEDLSPNFDMYLKHNISTQLDCSALNYMDGYNSFSLGSDGSLNYSFIKNESVDKKIVGNNELLQFKAKINNPESKLHVIYFVNTEKELDNLRNFMENIADINVKEAYVHLVCTSDNIKDYKELKGVITKFGYGFVPKLRVASVVGMNYISDEADDSKIDDYVTSLFYGYSELWRETDQKINNLIANNTLPCDIKTFCINTRYEIADNDNILIFNYTNMNVKKFIQKLSQIPEKIRRRYESIKYNIYSLFPIGYQIPSAFTDRTTDICVNNYLKNIYTKAAIIDSKNRLSNINYRCAGLKNIVCDNIDFFDSSTGILYNSSMLFDIINNPKYGLIVLNYNIDSFNTIKDIREEFVKIDDILSQMYRLCKDSNYTLFISSLYGIRKNINDGYGNEVFLNLSQRVPLIIIDPELNKIRKKLMIYPYGNIYDLAKTIYKNINPSYNIESLIREKQSLISLLFKKKK